MILTSSKVLTRRTTKRKIHTINIGAVLAQVFTGGGSAQLEQMLCTNLSLLTNHTFIYLERKLR